MLQEELWLSHLAEISQIEHGASRVLHEVFSNQLVSILERGETFVEGGVARWSARLEEEYIAVMPNGERWLVPPHVNLFLEETPENLSKDDERLIEILCDLTSFTEASTRKWYEAIPKLFREMLSSGTPVSWFSLGVFRQDEKGIQFIPSTELSERINRAFTSFAPISLTQDAVFEDIPVRELKDDSLPTTAAIYISRLSEKEQVESVAVDEEESADVGARGNLLEEEGVVEPVEIEERTGSADELVLESPTPIDATALPTMKDKAVMEKDNLIRTDTDISGRGTPQNKKETNKRQRPRSKYFFFLTLISLALSIVATKTINRLMGKKSGE